MALSNAVASKDASVLEGVLVEQRRTAQIKALCFGMVVGYWMVAEPVHSVKVRVYLMKGLRADLPELVVDCLEGDLSEELEGSRRLLAERHRYR